MAQGVVVSPNPAGVQVYRERFARFWVRIIEEARIGQERKFEFAQVKFDKIEGLANAKTTTKLFHKMGQVITLSHMGVGVNVDGALPPLAIRQSLDSL